MYDKDINVQNILNILDEFSKIKKFSVKSNSEIPVYPTSDGPYMESYDVENIVNKLKDALIKNNFAKSGVDTNGLYFMDI